ncbi:MAG: DUF4349 domain-containing protein [Spirochaetales bacterium]|nr:DUF4349 domain-containing protein [Spirochaetales bacterium]
MKKLLSTVLFGVIIFFALEAACGEEYRKVTIRATVIVFQPEELQNRIIGWIEEHGGYFLLRSNEFLSLRLPTEAETGFRHYIENLDGEVTAIDIESEDLREEILNLRSGIKSREDILAKNIALFGRADVEATLGIEKELVLLLNEIESLKGRLNKLETERKYLFSEISFVFKRTSLPEKIPSSFDWINTLNLYRFKKEGLPHEK